MVLSRITPWLLFGDWYDILPILPTDGMWDFESVDVVPMSNSSVTLTLTLVTVKFEKVGGKPGFDFLRMRVWRRHRVSSA